MGKIAALVIVAGPVANLVLASGVIILVMILLNFDAILIGTTMFGLYFFGLSLIYVIMSPVLKLMGFSRIFKATLALEGLVFLLFLAAYIYPEGG